MRNYREMDLNDLALFITLMTKVLRDRIVESGVDTILLRRR